MARKFFSDNYYKILDIVVMLYFNKQDIVTTTEKLINLFKEDEDE